MQLIRHYFHRLLIKFKQPDSCYRFFFRDSLLRQTITELRGDLKNHETTKYKSMYEVLTTQEMSKLMDAVKQTISSTTISNMSVIDNRMLNYFISEALLKYELDNTNVENDDLFWEMVTIYFDKLNNELNLVPHEQLSKNPYAALSIWLEHFINYPELYLNHAMVMGHGNNYIVPLLNLSECGCKDFSHDRMLGNVRYKIESMVLEASYKAHTETETQTLKLISMGPGGGLQDFIIVLKLFSMGIRDIELTLIDTEYNDMLGPIPNYVYESYCRDLPNKQILPDNYYTSHQGSIYSIIRALSLLSRHFNNANIKIFQYCSFEDLAKDHAIIAPFDIGYAIDLDDYNSCNSTRQDFSSLANYMKPTSQVLLSVHNQIKTFEVGQDNEGLYLKEPQVLEIEEPKIIDGHLVKKHSHENYFKNR